MNTSLLFVFGFIIVTLIGLGWRLYLNYEIKSLTDNSKETDVEDFLKLCQTTMGGRGRPSYAMTQDVEGVYILHNTSKDKYYVGQGKQVFKRVKNHFSGRGNGDVYADYKYGDAFTIKIIPLQDSNCNSLNELERKMIVYYNAYTDGYNRNRGNRN